MKSKRFVKLGMFVFLFVLPLFVHAQERTLSFMCQEIRAQNMVPQATNNHATYVEFYDGGKRIKLLLIVMWGMAVWQLADLILIGLGNPEIFDEYTGFWILAMIYKVVHIFLTIYIQKQLPSELDLLEMSLREQKKEIEALEQQCSQNNISMDEVWGTAEKYASRRTKAKGT
jgi:hypothetical protein